MQIEEYRVDFDETKTRRQLLQGEPKTIRTPEIKGVYISIEDNIARFGTPTEHFLIKHTYIRELIKKGKIKRGKSYLIKGNRDGLLRVYKNIPKYEDYIQIDATKEDLNGITTQSTGTYRIYRNTKHGTEAYGTAYLLSTAVIFNRYLKDRGYPSNARAYRVGAAHRAKQLNYIITDNIFLHEKEIFKKLDQYFNFELWPTLDEITGKENSDVDTFYNEIIYRIEKLEEIVGELYENQTGKKRIN